MQRRVDTDAIPPAIGQQLLPERGESSEHTIGRDHPAQAVILRSPQRGQGKLQDAGERWRLRMIWGREPPEEFGAALWRLACLCGYEGTREII